MFIGHFALGFAAKRAVPRVSLGMLFTAAQLADLLWPIFLMAGFEQVRVVSGSNPFTLLDFVSYPYSHSLLMLVVWGVVLGGLYRAIAGGRRTFVVLAALVVSHWLLDFVTHLPDMPLYPGSVKVGLGLWNSVPATIAVELPLFLVGVLVYVRTTRSRNAVGTWALYGLVAVLLAAYTGSIVGGAPPSIAALSVTAIIGFGVILTLAWWVDRHRVQY